MFSIDVPENKYSLISEGPFQHFWNIHYVKIVGILYADVKRNFTVDSLETNVKASSNLFSIWMHFNPKYCLDWLLIPPKAKKTKNKKKPTKLRQLSSQTCSLYEISPENCLCSSSYESSAIRMLLKDSNYTKVFWILILI